MRHAAVGLLAGLLVTAACSDGGRVDETALAMPEPRPSFAPIIEPPPTFAPVTVQAETGPTTSTTVQPAPALPPTTSPNVGTTPVGAEGSRLIDLLVVAPENPRAGYDRGLFDHWTDDDHDGCDTRCEVLETERRSDLLGLPAGGWLSMYDGYTTPDPGELEVDHVVALAEAWDSGAAAWDPARRRAFANDLEEPGALTAVTAATNRSKSDRDPAEWQPPNRDAWCEFATSWARVKVRWGLTADEGEVRALRNMVGGC